KCLLRKIRTEQSGLYGAVAVFSFGINILMLTGPLYMMQVYDRVLSSQSESTLVALSLIALFLFAIMGLFDIVRGAVLARVAARVQDRLDRIVFFAVLDHSRHHPKSPPHAGLRDVEALHRLMSSPAIHALFDIPWVPVFLLALWVFHPAMFALAVLGGGILIGVSLLNQYLAKVPNGQSLKSLQKSDRQLNQILANSDVIYASGMEDACFKRWENNRQQAVSHQLTAADRGGGLASLSKTLRLILQSAMLGMGAWLVIHAALSPGAMIAASVLLGRALAPIEALIGQGALVQRGRQAWASLSDLLDGASVETSTTGIAPRDVTLKLDQVTVVPPGERKAILRMVSFDLTGGDACGIIGPSGAGKTTLARVLTGLWHPAAGSVALGGVPLDKLGRDNIQRCIGYVPQSVTLFDGTIAENIARLAEKPDQTAVEKAAVAAGVAPLIEQLPDGYDTVINPDRLPFSGGEVQRIGLARALFGDPALIVLDEPNANLDTQGAEALNANIKSLRAENRILIVIAHRPAAIQECNLLMMIEDGTRKAFGPKEEILRKVVKNHADIKRKRTLKGIS
ncbi:MAG: type I secretion system permease/ATPase, partial [Pseudomonadota bacterium]